MKYILTGATGHIGNNLVRYLLNKNQLVKVLVRRENDISLAGLACEVVVGDLSDREFLENAIEEDSIVVHSLGMIDITNKYVDELMKVNFEMTISIVQACIKKKVRKFIYISSTDAINKDQGLIKDPTNFDLEGLNNYYAISKAMGSDYVLKTLRQGLLKGCIVCPSCVLGINDFKVSSQGSVIKKQLNRKIAMSTKGHYNFVDVDNIVDAIYKISINEVDEVYLLTGIDVDVNTLFKTIFKCLKRKARIIYFPLWIVKIGLLFMPIYYKVTKQKPIFTKMTIDTINKDITFDCSKAIHDFDYVETNFEELIKKTIEWFSNN